MVKAFPLNQQEYSYNAQDVMKYYAGRNSGVFETGDNLKVSVNSGLEVNVNSGVGWLSKDYVASVVFWNESPIALSVEAGDDTYNRIDLVVVSWNFPNQDKNPEIVIRKGTPSANPTVPSLVNDNSTIEIALAKINVAKGTVSLAESNIVDLRGDSTYCPMVYAEKTIKDTFGGCVGYSDGVNKISDFPNVTPASSDKILIEQAGEGKSATIANAVNTCALSYEEIMATTIDLTDKVASASALKHLKPITSDNTIKVTTSDTLSYIEGLYVTIPANCIFGIQVTLTYNSSRPLAVMLSRNTSGESPQSISYSEPNFSAGSVSCSLSSYTTKETTYYVWAKSLASARNDANIKYWYIQL